jgi:hypothetical protein
VYSVDRTVEGTEWRVLSSWIGKWNGQNGGFSPLG